MTASAWLGLTELLVITWQMVGSPPPRFQFETVPSVWSRLLPLSKVGVHPEIIAQEIGTGRIGRQQQRGCTKECEFVIHICSSVRSLLFATGVRFLAHGALATRLTNLDRGWRLCRFGVRRELSGKGEEMVGNFLIGPFFGYFAAAKALKMAGDDGYGANGI